MKILVCLLSAQHVPNLLSVLDQKPDMLFLVESKDMNKKNVGENFICALQHALQGESCSPVPRHIVFSVENENNLNGLVKTFSDEMLKRFPKAEWIINLTGGTKMMSLAAFQTFMQASVRQFVYFPLSSPNEVIFPLTDESYKIDNIVPMEAFLAGYGFEYMLNIKQSVQNAEKTARKRRGLTNLIASKCATEGFRIWGKKMVHSKISKWADSKHPAVLEIDDLFPSDEEILQGIRKEFNLNAYPSGSLLGPLNQHAVRYLDGCWLEEFVWNLLDINREALCITDVHLGITIRPMNTDVRNELDVSFIRNYGLNIVECKTGDQQERMTDHQYKLSAIANSFKALRYDTYLVSNSPKLERITERAGFANTKLVNGETIQELAKDPGNVELIKRKFKWA